MISTDIKKLYGVGAVRASKYEAMGIKSVEDLLLHYPRGYEDRGDIRLLAETADSQKHPYILTVATQPKSARIRGRMTLTKFRAYDDSASCEITFFNQDYLKNTFIPGTTFRFYGKAEYKGGKFTMISPAFEPWSEEYPLPSLIPVYPLTEGISQKQISKDIRAALMLYETSENPDLLPEHIRKKYSLCTRSYATKNIHTPESFSALAAAKRRLIFDEFFQYALAISITVSRQKKTCAHQCISSSEEPLLNLLEFQPTGAQRRVISEIKKDMSAPFAMSRIVIGDVGSGKTLCAAAAILFAVQSGHQAALMAPTEILARQHFLSLSPLFTSLGIRCELLLGATTAKEKKRIYASLKGEGGYTDVIIGTQAILSDGVEFTSLGLAVVDEQHRFGVSQRATLTQKNKNCHMLFMSATPIPRTMALALFGDLDISYIDEIPPGRQLVETFVVDEGYRNRLNAFIQKQCDQGGQVYVVCPAVEETENEEEEASFLLGDIGSFNSLLDLRAEQQKPLRSAVAFAKELSDALPALRVDFIHGKLKSKEKEERMAKFAAGEINVLVSTTVIEVGVNVPSASLMIIENAERFGLSTLHQLRGRVGRGTKKSYCVLVSDNAQKDSPAFERLNTLKSSHDGYSIAEKDLAMRGPGDFIRSAQGKVRQSGGVRFRLAEFCDDTGLMSKAFEEARLIVANDPSLSSLPLLKEEILSTVGNEEGYSN